jgi:hypothetical protein
MQYGSLDVAMDFIAPYFTGTLDKCDIGVDLWVNGILDDGADYYWQEWTLASEWYDEYAITGSNETGYTITITQEMYNWLGEKTNQTDGYVTLDYAWVATSFDPDYYDFALSANFTVGIQAEYTGSGDDSSTDDDCTACCMTNTCGYTSETMACDCNSDGGSDCDL